MKSFFNKVDINENNDLLFFVYSMSLNSKRNLPKNIIELIYDKFKRKPRFYGYPNFELVETIKFDVSYDDLDLSFFNKDNDCIFLACYI